MKEKESQELLLSVFGVAILIIVITGITYAVFRYTSKSEKINLITTSAIKMSYVESNTNVISINNALPISDYIGKKQSDYFDFTLSSTITGIMTINYDIVANRIDTENEIDPKKIKVYLEKKESGEYKEVLTPTNFSETSEKQMLLFKDSFINTENKTTEFSYNYRFRMWMDEKEQLEDIAKSFKVRINVYAET